MTRVRIHAIFKELLLIVLVVGAVYGLIVALASTSVGIRLTERFTIGLAVVVLGRHFYKSVMCYWLNVGILLGGIFSIFAIRQLCQMKIVGDVMQNEIPLWVILIILVILLINIVDRRLYRGIMTLILSGSWLIFCFIYPLYYTAEKNWFSSESVLAIMQSNSGESSSYLINHITLSGILLLLLLLSILSILIYLNVKYGGIKKLKRQYYVLMGIMVLLAVGTAAYMLSPSNSIQNKSYVMRSFIEARHQQVEYDKFKEMVSQRNAMLQELQVEDAGDTGLYVLVISESQTREHMSAYGYNLRETTPWLQGMMDAGKIISFKNAYSCHTHTVRVLTYALTSKNQYNHRKVENSVSIIDVAKAAGYHTIWLSNQSHYGYDDTPISVIADSADEQLFLENNMYGKISDYYDGALIQQLNSLQIKDKTLLVIHLMGCHSGYADRYPKEAGIFAGRDNDALYDNAVHYNDMVMKELYETLSQRPDFQGMIFFADHGEEPVELCHNWENFVPCMAEIPMYMIFSPQYQTTHEERYRLLQNHSKDYFTNDLMYNSLLGIMGLKETGSYEPENDISSKAYDGSLERFTTGYGEKRIEEIVK